MENNVSTISDWIEAIGTLISAIVSIILLVGLYYAAKQLKETTKWNKINATFTYFNNDLFVQRERAMVDALSILELDYYSMKIPLPEKELEEIFSSPMFIEARDYLDVLETYATAVNSGALENDCAYAIGYGFITRAALVFAPFVKKIRLATNHSDYYIEIEKLNLIWSERVEAERAKNALQISQLQKQLRISKGVQTKA